ncbi:ATP-dependent helicase [Longimonas halophila]|nr:ATP-dependent helicase [Longimonas halophila]
MLSFTDLTDAQQRIVRHHEGPALVFAVAGAGKTTSMVHRIRHLVEAEGVAPARILASSFSRATVNDLEAGIRRVGVRGVDTRTLHALGRQFIQQAEEAKHLPPRLEQQTVNPADAGRYLAQRALQKLAREQDTEPSMLGITASDLEDQIATWKGQLCYADLEQAHLPDRALEHAQQATHDNEDYLTLYRYAEAERDKEGWITFADMLMEGWEALMRFKTVREQAQSRYEQVLVDEFQDVNRSQHAILDVLTVPHRNYMAIGDDDQCIYAWRGANPAFILDFAETYDAKEYVLHKNFRSHAQQTTLANAVIQYNEQRRSKRIHLTRGVQGTADLAVCDTPEEEAEYVVSTIHTHLQNGTPTDDMVVLVRQYAQTPLLEQQLIDAEVPYRIVGSQPFYLRHEVQVLTRYLYWATLERTVREKGWFRDRRNARNYVKRFKKLLREPNCYVSSALVERVCTTALRDKVSLLDVLALRTDAMHDNTVENVDAFTDTIDGLVARLDQPAHETVSWLIDALDYEAYIRERSAFTEIADRRIQTAHSLATFAQGHATTQALLDKIAQISFNRPERGPSSDALSICSIHRAKGGEWPVVLVPGCNDGTLPTRANAGPESVPEEERRLFYVAVTRAQEALYLSRHDEEAPSPFLTEARTETAIAQCNTLRRVIEMPPDELTPADAVAVCVSLGALQLGGTLDTWWTPSDAQRQALRTQLAAAERRAEQLRKRARANPLAEGELLPVAVTHTDVLVHPDAPFTFASQPTDAGPVHVYQETGGEQRPVGRVALERSATLTEDDVAGVGGAAWSEMRGHLERRSNSGKTLYLHVENRAVEPAETSTPETLPDTEDTASVSDQTNMLMQVESAAYKRGKAALTALVDA